MQYNDRALLHACKIVFREIIRKLPGQSNTGPDHSIQPMGCQGIVSIKSHLFYLKHEIIRKAYNENNTSCFEGNTMIADPRARGWTNIRLRLRSVLPQCPRVTQSTYRPQNMMYDYNINPKWKVKSVCLHLTFIKKSPYAISFTLSTLL